jgi:putative transposase
LLLGCSLGIEAVYPKPKLSLPGEGHKIYPYLLRDVKVTRLNQVWSTDSGESSEPTPDN